MKTIKVWLLALFLASPIFLYSNFRTMSGKAFQLEVHPAADAASLRLDVQKATDKPVHVQLLDKHDTEMARHSIDAPIARAQVKLNIAELPAGTYRLLVSDNQSVSAKQVTVSVDPNNRAARRLVISPAN